MRIDYNKEEEKDYIKMLFKIRSDNSKYVLYNEKIDAFNTKYIQLFFERVDIVDKEKIITNSTKRAENMVFILNCDKDKAQKYCLLQEINNYLTPKRGDEEKTIFNYILEFLKLDNFFANGLFFNLISYEILFIGNEKTSDSSLDDGLYFCYDIISLSFDADEESEDLDKQINGLQNLFYNELFWYNDNISFNEKELDDARYEQIYKDLKPFIDGASADIYSSIIEDKKLPKNTDAITMISGKKPDIIRFGDCFDIKPAQLSVIFGEKVVPSDRNKTSKNELLRTLKKYNRNLYCKSSK